MSIWLRNVGLEYRRDTLRSPRQRVFERVNAVIPDRSHVAILGAASSGKTTLLKLMCGALAPSRGVVAREGSVSFPVGFVGASGRVSVMQYIQFAAKCYGVDAKALLRYVVDFAGLEDVLHRPTGKLESERRSRLNMTLGYALPFDHYLFDQRIAVGDPEFRSKCLGLFEARRSTAGIVVATRHSALARQFCTSAYVLHKGSLIYFEDIDRAIDFYEEAEPNPIPRSADVYYRPAQTFSLEDQRSDDAA